MTYLSHGGERRFTRQLQVLYQQLDAVGYNAVKYHHTRRKLNPLKPTVATWVQL